jgi:ferric-dicitrate binding protein FerR (iron transport regulator)
MSAYGCPFLRKVGLSADPRRRARILFWPVATHCWIGCFNSKSNNSRSNGAIFVGSFATTQRNAREWRRICIWRKVPRRESIAAAQTTPRSTAQRHLPRKRRTAMLGTILIVILILMLLGALPTWNHSRNWGYGPSGGLGLVVVILLILLLLGRFPY